MRTLLLLFLATMLVCAPALGKDDEPPSKEALLAHPAISGALAVIDAWVAGTRHYEQVPGISVGIVHDQDLIWTAGYGFSNLAKKRLADADTIYSVCSISKLFTAIGIMQLRDEGQLALHDSVANHLDWFEIEQAHEGSGPITIESLLTHSSGLPRESDSPYWVGPEFPFPTRSQMIDRLAAQKTLYPSQHYFQYSNLALSLAGEIVAERSGQDYDTYINRKILEPLGMADTRTNYPANLRGEQLAIGYTGMHRDLARKPVNPFFTRGITAAAGFTSSVNDLATFASWQFRLLENGGTEVLNANTLREMHRVHWVDPDWETTWGIGFNVRREEDITFVSHGGGCPGYITSFTMMPKNKLATIVLTNAGDGPAGRLAVDILKVAGPAFASATKPAEEPIPDLSMYEGNFESRPWGGETAVRQWGDQLVVIDLPGNDLEASMIRLEHDQDHTFTRLTEDDERREPWTFELGDEGTTTRILHHSSVMSRIE